MKSNISFYSVTVYAFLIITLTACSQSRELTEQSAGEPFDPAAIFLTWQNDPATTMTIDWHSTPEDGRRGSELHFRKDGESEWKVTQGTWHSFPHSDRMIHRVELRRLEPATIYHFRFGEDSKEYHFRTMPGDLSEPVRFVTGGDTSHSQHDMTAVAMTYDPDFILWGGDLAYANGTPERAYRWYGWFDGIKENLISEDGRVVPVLVAIGNHELFRVGRLTRGSDPMSEEEIEAYLTKHNLWDRKATYFFDLFAFPGRQDAAWEVLDFADYMSVIILDSDHNYYPQDNPVVEGVQTGWLDAVLKERQDRPHVFPVYHVPAYPSHRSFDGGTSTRIREHWVPLFEKYGVRVAFENHDHTYKRTHPIRDGKIAEDGIVYMGDGNWGRSPRSGENKDEWYINRFESLVHGIVVTVSADRQEYIMVDDTGREFDSYTITISP